MFLLSYVCLVTVNVLVVTVNVLFVTVNVLFVTVHFQSKPLMNFRFFFATVHSLMKDINLIDSCQAHLPVQYASNIECIRQE